MSGMQRGIVFCAMFQDTSHVLQILTPTPHWEKQITDLVCSIFYYVLYYLIPKYSYISLG